MYTTLIILIIIATALMVTAVILLLKRINECNTMLQDYYKKLDDDILEGICIATSMETRLDYALSRLPKTRSKKIITETEGTETIIKNIEPVED